MSKKVSSVDPISLLREYITNNKPIKHSEEMLYFGSSKLPLSSPTAWNPKITNKQYSLGDLWLFLDSQLNPSKYPENKYYDDMKKYGLQIVSAHDREEIINYFTGKIEDSEAINQELKASIKLNKDKKKSSKPKYDGEPPLKKKVKTDEEGKEVGHTREGRDDENEMIEESKQDNTHKEKENLRLMDLLFRLEKPIDSKNRALRKPNKSFKSVIDLLTSEQKPAQEATETVQPKKQSMTRIDEVLNASSGGLEQSKPIILVLNVPTSGGLSLENAKEFLEQGQYKDPLNDKKEGGLKSKQTVTREIGGRKVTFDIMADPIQIKKDLLWPRVVAIFVTGYTHQFQGWPDGDRISVLFSKKRAFHMKYHDVPLHDNIKKWNVKLLEIHRTKRFLDSTVKNHFWEDLETFLLQPPK